MKTWCRRRLSRGQRWRSVGVLSIVVTAGCASDNTETTPESSAESPPSDVTDSTTTTQPLSNREAFLTSSGVLYLYCDERDASTQLNFRTLDPNTGAITTGFTTEITPPATGVTLSVPACANSDRLLAQAPVPNPTAASDWSKLAVAMKGFVDGSEHVGYFDVDQGTLVDLTAGLPQADFANAPRHTNIFFATDQIIHYSDDVEVYAIDLAKPATALPSARLRQVPQLSFGRSLNAPVVSAAGSDMALREDGALVPPGWISSPSGELVAGECKGNNGILGNFGICVLNTTRNLWLSTPINYQHETFLSDPIPLRVIDPSLGFVAVDTIADGCEAPVVWLDDQRVLTAKLEVLAAAPNSPCQPFLPGTDRANFSPILSSDRATILFQSEQGDVTTLFVTSPSASSPRRIADVATAPSPTPPLTGTVMAWNP